ncbi:MAG TPA: glucoamylase family protein, partial [Caldilineaceae bacterium]|nr:glucoamylase family protein [Caldilineaceae bacterium]
TVDSGNLAAALIALKHGCLAQKSEPMWRWERWAGLLDTLTLLDQALAPLFDQTPSPDDRLRATVGEIQRRVMAVRTDEGAWYPLLIELGELREELNQGLLELVESHTTAFDPELIQRCRIYVERVHAHGDNLRRDADRLQPWLGWLKATPALFREQGSPRAVRSAWEEVAAPFPLTPPLDQVSAICQRGQEALDDLCVLLTGTGGTTPDALDAARWCQGFAADLRAAQEMAEQLVAGFTTLAQEANQWVVEMDFGFLFDAQRQVFHIGYNVDAGLLDRNYYDLLASEARIASLVAIAKFDIPQSHWLHLGRPLTTVSGGAQALLSWSGTMFEYLMPPLLLRHYQDTLLDATSYAVTDQQIAYGRSKNRPWGISESGFYVFDAGMSYQYQAFGVPGLGFKRGLSEDLVVAPYAALLALPFRPHAVLENLAALQALGAWGRYGLYEAVDFTRSRLLFGQDYAIVREYMAHHQGMILVAIDNLLNDNHMVERFHAEPAIQSVELLLQEQIPHGAPLQYPHENESNEPPLLPRMVTAESWRVPVNTPVPLVHYLANGRYGLLFTNAGTGYSRWQEQTLTRWRADTTLDEWGCWLYVQDLDTGACWSAGLQPTGAQPEYHEIHFAPHQVEIRRRDLAIALHMAVTVAPEDDVEVRRITLTNDSDQPRRLRLTTYGEVVLGPAGGDLRHPAFGKLFIESEYEAELNSLLFRRRPRSSSESPAYLAHMLLPEAGHPATGVYESDRARFLGRGGSQRQPAALAAPPDQPWLSGTTGATLDPVMALGQVVELAPHQVVQLAVLTVSAPTRETLLALLRRYRNWSTVDRTFARARSAAETEMRELNLTSAALEQFQRLLSLLFYPSPALRAEPATLAANRLNQSGLWAYGVSGDYPIVLVRLKDENQGELLQELLQAHIYWRRRGLLIDLVVLNQQETNYGQPVQGYIQRMIERMDSNAWLNQRGGIFVLREDQMGEAERALVHSVARAILDGEHGSLGQQLAGLLSQPAALPPLEPTLGWAVYADEAAPVARPTDLQFDNGLGGFAHTGDEYVLYLHPRIAGGLPPAPWINVLSNADFGALVSESGGGYSWAENSGENRLTPWRNDPVSDRPAEALYLRDEETVAIWSPWPQPAPDAEPYLVRHGLGYSTSEHHSFGLRQETRLFVARDAPVKVVRLRLENTTQRPRRLTATYYAEWVLGVEREGAQLTLIPDYDDATYTLLARNPYSFDFGERVAFLSCSKRPHGLTADRSEFLGRHGQLDRPAAMQRVGLEGRVQAGLDPCAALQLHIDLEPGGSEEIYFLLGQGADRQAALELVQRFQQPDEVATAWQRVQEQWHCLLGAVQVETPDPAMNLLLNRWLLYQAL